MSSLIIALLIALGIITSPADFHNMSSEDQVNTIEIIIDDIENHFNDGNGN